MALSCNIQTTTRVDRTTKPNSPGVSSPPPPPYDYVVNNNDNQKHVTTIPDDPWLHRMTSLDETMKQMRDALQDTQAMMYETKARLSRLESSLERIAAFEPSSSPSSSIDLNRINNSLEQLIEQAQASLRSRVSLSDPTWMSVHRSTSMPELTTRFIMNRRRSSEPQNIHPKQTVSKYNAHNRQKTNNGKTTTISSSTFRSTPSPPPLLSSPSSLPYHTYLINTY
ncbi:hypothetical protein VTP01DRAFT_9037 [Rhizomucor pusillus]|uniref:uncharacterized protein n=1 Tax=Rhizomucor pusillus TaxID=4840 RepID=UPI003742A6F2